MKIKHMQWGGVVYTAPQPAARNQPVNNDKNSTDQLILKSMIDVLKENGLNNDVDLFLAKSNEMLSNSRSSIFGSNGYDMGDLMRIISMANQIKNNKEQYTLATTHIGEENSGSEVAMTSNGSLYVYSENGLSIMDPGDFYNKRDTYRALTNNDLLNIRSNNSSAAFDTTMLLDLSNSIGMESIKEYVKSLITSFGKTSYDMGTSEATKNLSTGLKTLTKIAKGESHQGYTIGNNESLDFAVMYLYDALPANMRHFLRATAAAEGKNPNNQNDVLSLFYRATILHTDHSFDYDQSGKNGEKYGGGDSSNKNVVQDNWVSFIHKDRGTKATYPLVLPGGKINFGIESIAINSIATPQGSVLTTPTLLTQTINNLDGHGLVDKHKKIFFGDVALDTIKDGSSILIDNSKGAYIMYLPIDDRGKINTQMFKEMTNIQKQIVDKRITDEKQVKQLWEDNGYEYDPINKTGKPKNTSFRRYWAQPAYTSTAALTDSIAEEVKQSELIEKDSNDYIQDLENMYNAGQESNNQIKVRSGWFGSDFQSLIFIPINENVIEGLTMVQGTYTKKPLSNEIAVQQQLRDQYEQGLHGTTFEDLK